MTDAPKQQTHVMIKKSDLPESMQEIADLLGMDAAMKLLKAIPGIRMFIPKKLPEKHLIYTILGEEDGKKLCVNYGGETITFPRAAKALRIARDMELQSNYDAGTPVRSLAISYKLTERQVYNILSTCLTK